MNLKQLEAFVQVSESGSFSKAAKELFLTQPTISSAYFLPGKGIECTVIYKKYKRSKPVR